LKLEKETLRKNASLKINKFLKYYQLNAQNRKHHTDCYLHNAQALIE